jgi:hypothetical protein
MHEQVHVRPAERSAPALRWTALRIEWVALGVLLLAGGLVLIRETRGTTFFADEWAWILDRRGPGLHTFLDPHNQHLSLIPVIVYKLLFATVGLRHYSPYRGVLIATHLLVVALIFVYAKTRAGGYLALVAAALILFFGPGGDNILWPFQMAWLFAVAAGIGALLLLDRGDRLGDAGACVLLGVSLASAGPGLAVAVGLVVEVAQRRRWRDAWIVAAPLALYAIWWIVYQQASLQRNSVLYITRFIYNAAAAAVSGLAGLLALDPASGGTSFRDYGPALLLIAVALLVWRLHSLGCIPPRALTLMAMILSFWLITGLGRSYVPVGGIVLAATGDEDRYIYVGAVLIVLLVVELARGSRPTLPVSVVVGVLAIAAISANIGVLRDHAAILRGAALQTESDLGTLDLTRAIVDPSFPSAGFIFQIVQARQYFAVEHSLGTPAAGAAQIAAMPDLVRAGADAQLIAIHRLALQPAPGPASGNGAAPTVDAAVGGTASSAGACTTFRPAPFSSTASPSAIELPVPAGGLALRSAGGPASVAIRRFSVQFQKLGIVAPAAWMTLRITPDLAPQPWHLQVTAPGPVVACSLG